MHLLTGAGQRRPCTEPLPASEYVPALVGLLPT